MLIIAAAVSSEVQKQNKTWKSPLHTSPKGPSTGSSILSILSSAMSLEDVDLCFDDKYYDQKQLW